MSLFSLVTLGSKLFVDFLSCLVPHHFRQEKIESVEVSGFLVAEVV